MKTAQFSILMLFFLGMLVFLPNAYAQDYTKWSLPEGAKARLGKGQITGEIVYSPDGSRLAVVSSIGIWIYDADTIVELNLLTGPTSISNVVFSPDGNTLASGSWDDSMVRLWDVRTGQSIETLTGHTSWVTSVAFSSDGNTLASGSEDRTIRLWDVATRQLKNTLIDDPGDVSSVAFSPDGTMLASGNWEKTVRLWDVATGQLIATLMGHKEAIRSVAFSPDGSILASGSYDQTVRLWDAWTGQPKTTLMGHQSPVFSVAFSPDGATLASGGSWRDGTVRLWDADTGQPKAALAGHADIVSCVAFSPDGTTLATGGHDNLSGDSGYNRIRLWDADTGQLKTTLVGHMDSILSVVFSPDGSTLASGGGWPNNNRSNRKQDAGIRLWDVTTGQLKATLTGATDSVGSVAFSPDGTKLASGSRDHKVQLWDVVTRRLTATFRGDRGPVNSVAFSPDGNTLATGNGDWRTDGTVQLWEVTTGQLISTLTGHTDEVSSVAFSPDGTTLASGSEDGIVLLWNLAPPMDTAPQMSVYDVNRDGIVNLLDLATLAEMLGQKGDGLSGDINDDGVVNIFDLVAVSAHFDNAATLAAPAVRRGHRLFFLTPTDVSVTPETIQKWIAMAHTADDGSLTFRRGIVNLYTLLAMLTPAETALLPNYPNPFNPETWIPYRLAHAADVTLTIYDTKGAPVRQFGLGYQPAGYYTNRAKAAYWDGRSETGEPAASGVYFYSLSAGNYSATRKMLILK